MIDQITCGTFVYGHSIVVRGFIIDSETGALEEIKD